MNTFTQKLTPEEKIRRSIIFVCCEGYREISRNRVQPICRPICQRPCGGGYCYGPNVCLCNFGFQLSDQGVCTHSEVNKFTLNTRFGIDTKRIQSTRTEQPSKSENDFHRTLSIPFGSSEIETTIPTSTKHSRFEAETTIMHTQNKISLIPDYRFHMTSIIPIVDFDSKMTFPTSPHHQLEQDESSTINSNRRNKSHTKLVSNSDDIQEATEVSESLNLEFTQTPVFSFNSINPKTQTVISSKSESTRSNYQPASFESVPICISDYCHCQPGYELFEGKFCRSCATGSKCNCKESYVFDSKALQCKPLCTNAEQIGGDIFPCYSKKGEVIQEKEYLKKWYLILLLIPAGLVAFILYTVIKRRRSAKSNRLRSQKRMFQEIRYFNTSGDETSQKRKYQQAGDENTIDEPLFHIQRSANVVVVTI